MMLSSLAGTRSASTSLQHCRVRGGSCEWPQLTHACIDDVQAQMPGLSGVVDAQLGSCLDKAQQCSSWHVRPLTWEQVRNVATSLLL